MTILCTCPDCGKKSRIRDELAGKKIRCPACEAAFVAETGEDEERLRAARKSPAADRPSKAAPERRRGDRDDDDASGERPARRRRAREDSDHRPRPPKRRPLWPFLVGGGGLLLILLAVGGIFALVKKPAGGGGGGLLGGVLSGGETAKETPVVVPLPVAADQVERLFFPAGAPGRVYADIREPGRTRIDVYDLATRQVVQTTATKHNTVQMINPEGTLAAIQALGGIEALGRRQPYQMLDLKRGDVYLKDFSPVAESPRDFGGGMETHPMVRVDLLARTRFLALFEGGEMAVFIRKGKTTPRGRLLPHLPRKDVSQFASTRFYKVLPDGKTIALWNEDHFDLLDTDTGQVRGKSGKLAFRGEKPEPPTHMWMHPDGSHILSHYAASIRTGGSTFAHWDLNSGKPANTFRHTMTVNVIWWGKKHALLTDHVDSQVNGEWSKLVGNLVDLETGTSLGIVQVRGEWGNGQGADGNVWCLFDRKPGCDLVGVPFPESLMPSLTRRATGHTGTEPPSFLEITPEGVVLRDKAIVQ